MSKVRSTLEKSTGLGEETEGIRYPVPSVNTIAILEQEYGPLDLLLAPVQGKKIIASGRALTDDEKKRITGANQIRMMIWLLEMQKAGKDEEIESMSSEERCKAAAKCMKMKKIDMSNLNKYAKAVNAVFTKASRPSKK